jgi:hypothetical protein
MNEKRPEYFRQFIGNIHLGGGESVMARGPFKQSFRPVFGGAVETFAGHSAEPVNAVKCVLLAALY